MKKHTLIASSLLVALVGSAQAAENYGPYPITVKGYDGKKTNSVAYTGQMARHTLHNSLKKLSSKGDGTNAVSLEKQMLAYYAGKEAGRDIIDPATKGDFKVKQSKVDELSKKKNLKGKTFKGAVPGFPGQMTGPEVIEFLIKKAAQSEDGYDPLTGYDYKQLISKFAMGAVFYNQAVDNYLDEKLEADVKPNNKPYKEGKHYTGKEHSWDEGFGYFGAPAHALNLTPKQVYGIAKKKDLAVADANKDGVVDLITEMTYAHAYYAADADKSGKTNYLHGITQAFVDGRKLISSANGEALASEQRNTLKEHAALIKTLWQQVLAEATFKYAGSVYKDINTLQAAVKTGSDPVKPFRKYAKHWGELKGFALAMQASGRDLGETAVKMNRLIGYGPVLIGGSQVQGIGADGKYTIGGDRSMGDYQVHMVKLQALLADRFGLQAKKNDVTGELAGLVESLGKSKSVEND